MSSEESGGHSGSSVLYDVLVYNEWHQQEEEQEEPREEEEATRQWSLRDWSSRFLRGNRQCPLSRLRQLRELRTSWQLSVSPDAALVAVAQEQVLEILSRRYGLVPLFFILKYPFFRNVLYLSQHLLFLLLLFFARPFLRVRFPC